MNPDTILGGGNLTELDLANSDGLCTLCRDIAEAVPA